MKRLLTNLLLIFGILILTASSCITHPPPDLPPAVIIPKTTVIVNQESRESLLELSDTGLLRFSDTAQLQAVEIGNVLVSEPSAAAPYGYLRKVTAIRQEAGELLIETVAATLDEAVDEGELNIEEALSMADLESAQMHLQGVTLVMPGELTSLQIDKDKYDFTLSFNKVLYDLDGDEDTKGDQVTLSGKLQFDIVVSLKAKLRLIKKPKHEFEAKLGFRKKSELNFDAIAALQLKKEVKVADLNFGTKVFFIGPVPVVYTPKIEIVLGVEGDLRARTKITVEQTISAQVGAKYTSDDGWKNLSEATLDNKFKEPDIDGVGTKAKGYVGPKAIILFYGVVGIGAFSKVYGELDLKLGRDPHWLLMAGLSVDLGIEVKLPVIGNVAEFKLEVINRKLELSRSQNAPPTLEILEPKAGAVLTLNRQASLLAKAEDVEDGVPDITWISSVEGVLGSSSTIFPIFTTAGQRILTAVVTDSKGLSVTKTVTVEVVNTPPEPFVVKPEGTIPATSQVLLIGSATDANDPNEFGQPFGIGVVSCDRITWSVNAPDTLSAASGCQVSVVFNAQGTRTVTLTATDIHGASTSLDAVVSVAAPPPNPAPVIDSISVSNKQGDSLQRGDTICTNCDETPLMLSVSASDPDGDILSYRWQASSDGSAFVDIGTTATLAWNPAETFIPPFPQFRSLVIRVAVSDGTTEILSPSLEFSWGERIL